MQSSRQAFQHARRRRTGVITLELILTLPILMTLLLAIVEFGLALVVAKQVSFASRYGAKISAETPEASLDTFVSSGGLRALIDAQLAEGGIDTGACRIIVRHNLADPNDLASATRIDEPANGCECGFPPVDVPTLAEYVSVTVCVPLEGNIPDLVGYAGFSLEGCFIEETTTYPFEPTP